MALTELDLPALRRWLISARADLAAHAAVLDQLNVFPVPDGDTGTNMRLTIADATRALARSGSADLVEATQVFAHAALTGARGNSGMILSQVTRGFADAVAAAGGAPLDAPALARALRAGSDRAVQAVSRPVEGTILSVARAAADGAEASAGGTLAEVVQAAVDSGRRALNATPEQLEVLRDRGVVDAGGAGYLLVLEALHRVVHGRPGLAPADRSARWRAAAEQAAATSGHRATDDAVDEETGGTHPQYEVMYLLIESDDAAVRTLRAALDAIGDSVVVAGGPLEWSVHVHTDDIAAALEAGATAGRQRRFSVTRFADAAAHSGATTGTVLIAAVTGDGLGELVRSRGGRVEADPRSLDDLRDALILCDDQATVERLRDQWADRADLIVTGGSPARAVATLDVVDLAVDPVTLATRLREALSGVQDFEAAADIDCDGLLAEIDARCAEPELLTVVAGAGLMHQARTLGSQVQSRRPELEVVVVDGGGPVPLDVAVE